MNRRNALLGAAALAACGAAGDPASALAFPIRRGVNLGNALEAPNEGEWGYRIEWAHLDAIRAAGFDGVRVPVRWNAHQQPGAPYQVDSAFMDRVAAVVDAALGRRLQVQLDVHHNEPLLEDPDAQTPRYQALWRQIAARFQGYPPGLLFEPLNEPHEDIWSGARVTRTLDVALAEIRPRHPDRLVVIGGPNWNSIDGLAGWTPPQDRRLALTVHYYAPHDFTHQDAAWLGADAPRFGRAWGNAADVAAVRADIARAAAWADAHGLALQCGEFGVNKAVPVAQRALWTRRVREAFESVAAGWCVWDFAGQFPIYDLDAGRFIPEMRAALIA